jgi:hypothetical protein
MSDTEPDSRQSMPDALLPTALDSRDIGDNSCRSVRICTHLAHREDIDVFAWQA